MIYVHHQPKTDAAARFTEFVREQKGTPETVSPSVSRTAENSAQLSAPAGTEYATAAPSLTPAS
jgi:hypothetical protein